MRHRDERFVDEVNIAVAKHGLPLSEESQLTVYDEAYPTRPLTAKGKLNWVSKKLRQPDIREALADVFGDAGMTIPYLLDKVKEHIDGGSYPALKDVLKMVLPVAPTKHQVSSVNVNVDMPPQRVGPPEMQARLLGSALVEMAHDE